MLKKYSTIFSNLMIGLYDMQICMLADSFDKERKSSALDTEESKKLEYFLIVATNMANELGLDAVFKKVERMWESNKGGYLRGKLSADIQDLISRIEDQLSSRLFKFVDMKRAHYYHEKMLFGEKVNASFPNALSDIEDAGKCIALDLATSAVMHLMRVMEEGLKALSKALDIEYAPSWEAYLTKIENNISAKHKSKDILWKEKEKFYRDISGDLLNVKQAWRNPTMHIERRYTTEEAEQIFLSIKLLMQKLAIGL